MPTAALRHAALAMFSAISDAAAVLLLDGDELRVVEANPAFAAGYQTTPEQLRGQLGTALYKADEYADLLERVRETLRLKAPVRYEAVRELPNGRHIIAATMVPAGADQVVVLKRDVSATREALHRLAELESLASIGSWQWNLETDAVTWSDQYRRMLGFSPDVSATMAIILDAIHPDDRHLVTSLIDAVSAGREKPRTITFRVVRPDGQVRFMETRANVAHDDAAGLVRIFGTIQDITERHIAERYRQQLERSQQRQDHAAELNDDIVQGLAAAWLALQLGEIEEAMDVVQRTSHKAQQRVSELLGSPDSERPVASGVLARRVAANADTPEQAT